ncbi:hypothetical protein [Nonomuraea sp. NPDC049695]|uniref:hypothetical protein n=1 Tax=Nonomuraea sp. NPDC049695 TaxID=3154734 RepID=UPI00342A58F4
MRSQAPTTRLSTTVRPARRTDAASASTGSLPSSAGMRRGYADVSFAHVNTECRRRSWSTCWKAVPRTVPQRHRPRPTALSRSGSGSAWSVGPPSARAPSWAISPVVARDEETARALIGDLALHAGGEVRMDFDLAMEGMVRWAAGHGVGNPWQVSKMVRGGDLPGERACQFLPFMQALG